MAKSAWLTIAALLLLLVACKQAEGPLTQVIVAVDASADVRDRLTRVVIRTYDPQPDTDGERELVSRAPFAINDSGGPGTATFPFSVGVLKSRADSFLLVVTGYEADARGSERAVIEQTALVGFVDGQTSGLGIYLATACLDQLCESDSDELQTCRAEEGVGACGSLPDIDLVVIAPGSELDAGLIDPTGTEPMDGSPGPDSGDASDTGPDSGDGETGAPPTVALAEPGQPCAPELNQRLACAGHASRQPLRCNGTIWEPLDRCAENARCDSRVGRDQGTCLTVPAACLGKSEGDVCDGKGRWRCGPDLVNLEEKPCGEHSHCDAADGVRCVCAQGYDDDGSGACINHPDCPPGACAGGRCVDGISDYSCECGAGFTGTGSKTCTPAKYCPPNACVPAGTCVDVPEWSCTCNSGFSASGPRACTPIDDCPTDRCRQPNGTCRDGINLYTCECNAGYSGPDCSVDACSPNPCQHGGTCQRTAQSPGYSCNCGASGYGGTNCERDVDECATTNLCTYPDYRCAQTAVPGYLCLGQFADWPMPSSLSGSRVGPSYDTTTTAGVAIDRVTGLSWQSNLPATYAGCSLRSGASAPVGDRCTWAEARNYCQTLMLAGGPGWRLPSKIELESILDETRTPAFDAAVFPGTPADFFWTNSTVPARTGNWLVAFDVGASSTREPNMGYPVRCVRGQATQSGTPSTRFRIDTTAGTVTDTRTGLVWQQAHRAAASWSAAQTQCTGGFRLPAFKELLTLVDPTRVNFSNDPAFPDAPRALFWSASPFSTDAAYYVHVFDGYSGLGFRTDTNYVRCVR